MSRTWSTVFSTALAAKLIIKAEPGRLRSLAGRLDATAGSATYYVQLWDLADVPTDTTTTTPALGALMAPYKIVHVSGTDDKFSLDFAEGIIGKTGLVVGLSSTEFTKTAAGAFLSVTAEMS